LGSLRRKVIQPWVIMPLVALVALGGWIALRPEPDAQAQAATAPTAQLVAATTGSMAETVSAEGTVAAAKTDDLSFSSAGKVTAVKVAAGDNVKAGDVLATIDSAELAAAVTEADATVADAEASLSDDTAAGASDAQLTADQSTLDSARDKLDTANEALAGASLVATFDGTVAAVNISVGEELASGGTGGTGTTGSGSGSGQSSSTLGSGSGTGNGSQANAAAADTASPAQIQVISKGVYTVDLSFDATDVAHLAAGQTATVAVTTSTASSNGFPGGGFRRGFPGATGNGQTATPAAGSGATTTTTAPAATTDGGVTGFVTEVGKVADASSGVATYPVTVAFSDTTGDFNPGATASVVITYAQKANVVQVPTRAITATNGASTVTLSTDGKEGGKTETRTVTTGLASGGMTEITSGLKAGEQVVITFGARFGAGAGATPPAGATPGGAVQTQGAGG
jgi:membrane fusion protein, macrolide-specific efflux system